MLKMVLNVKSQNNERLAKYIKHRTGDDFLKMRQTSGKNKYKEITLSKIKNKILYFYTTNQTLSP